MFEEEKEMIKVIEEAGPSAKYLVGFLICGFFFALGAGAHNDFMALFFAIVFFMCVLKFIVSMLKEN